MRDHHQSSSGEEKLVEAERPEGDQFAGSRSEWWNDVWQRSYARYKALSLKIY